MLLNPPNLSHNSKTRTCIVLTKQINKALSIKYNLNKNQAAFILSNHPNKHKLLNLLIIYNNHSICILSTFWDNLVNPCHKGIISHKVNNYNFWHKEDSKVGLVNSNNNN